MVIALCKLTKQCSTRPSAALPACTSEGGWLQDPAILLICSSIAATGPVPHCCPQCRQGAVPTVHSNSVLCRWTSYLRSASADYGHVSAARTWQQVSTYRRQRRRQNHSVEDSSRQTYGCQRPSDGAWSPTIPRHRADYIRGVGVRWRKLDQGHCICWHKYTTNGRHLSLGSCTLWCTCFPVRMLCICTSWPCSVRDKNCV